MSKTTINITIADPMKVKVGDKAYFKNCDFGFTVTGVDTDDKDSPIAVYNPLSGEYYWIFLPRFDHATRDVKKLKWPDPHDFSSHVYIGSDGKQYIYEPCSKHDPVPWTIEHDQEPWTTEVYGTYRFFHARIWKPRTLTRYHSPNSSLFQRSKKS